MKIKIEARYAISILSAGQLAGISNLEMVTRKGAILEAALAAKEAGFAVQLLPLSTPGLKSLDDFFGFIYQLATKGVNVMSFEDRWGGSNWRHPWAKDFRDGKYTAVVAYYLLFPWHYAGVEERLRALRKTGAVAIDLPGGPMEIDLHKGSAVEWVDHFSIPNVKQQGVVLDTFHFLEFSWTEQDTLLRHLQGEKVPVRLLHLQFRDEQELNSYLAESLNSATWTLVRDLRNMEMVDRKTKIVIELEPTLVSPNTLRELVDVTDRILEWVDQQKAD